MGGVLGGADAEGGGSERRESETKLNNTAEGSSKGQTNPAEQGFQPFRFACSLSFPQNETFCTDVK